MADKFETKDMTGTLFVNRNKKTDKHPDRTGKIKINNVEYRLSGWIKKSEKTGESWMSLAISEANEGGGSNNTKSHNSHEEDDF